MNARLQERWAEIEPMLDEILETEPAARPELLSRMRTEHPELTEELECLMEAVTGSKEFLQEAAPAYVAPLIARVLEGTAFLAGTQLGPYELTEVLGRGGTATVYLANDPKHGRQVAVKVPHKELALGSTRFLSEIHIAARLQHPNILPLHDSGEMNGTLYYVMPYVEGESLRERLAREGKLPIKDAVHIASQVAEALTYAHAHGIVHRDIKPENILLSQGHALVADFGIARAITIAAEERLQETGPLGTAAYMSPEQAEANPQLDGRSDIYSLGCVLFEMLVGRPPFTGSNTQDLLLQHKQASIPDPRLLRPAVPVGLKKVITTTLAKLPDHRFGTASEFLNALEGAWSRSTSWWASRAGIPVAIVIVLASILGRHDPYPALDRGVVAVLPFRVSGADPSLGYLREGMLDLLATKLSGTKALRTVDPHTLLYAWRQRGGSVGSDVDRSGALQVARKTGAGRLLQGEVIGPPDHLVLNAMLTDISGGGEIRSSVEGRIDSLTTLVDRLAAQLLILDAGEGQHRLSALTTTSLPALRVYLDGRAAYRRGDFGAARNLFDRALELDSTFALAGIGRTQAAIWFGDFLGGPGSYLAWRHRDRLSPRDRALLDYMLGHKFPNFGDQRDGIDDAEALVRAMPDNPEAWASLGDIMYHYGKLVGIPDALERSRRAYERGLSLDSGYVPCLEHLHQLRLRLGDTLAAREAVHLRLRVDSTTQSAAVDRWFGRRVLGDSSVRSIALSDDSLLARARVLVRLALHHGARLEDAESVLTFRQATASGEEESRDVQNLRWTFYVIRGQPARARTEDSYTNGALGRAEIVLAGLYADLDSAVAGKVAAQIPRTFGPVSARTSEDAILDAFAAAQYDLMHGRLEGAREVVRAWTGVWNHLDTTRTLVKADLFRRLLDTQLAELTGRSDLRARLVQLDSVMQAAPTSGQVEALGNVILARLWHKLGDEAKALSTVRRRVIGLGLQPLNVTELRDEARYAAAVGDKPGALRAYRQYLTLRSDPESSVRPKVEEVRAELASLEGEFAKR